MQFVKITNKRIEIFSSSIVSTNLWTEISKYDDIVLLFLHFNLINNYPENDHLVIDGGG